MKNLGIILLLCGIAVPLCAMQDQVQGGDLASLARRSMEGEEKSPLSEDPTCAICFDGIKPEDLTKTCRSVNEIVTQQVHKQCLDKWNDVEPNGSLRDKKPDNICQDCRSKLLAGTADHDFHTVCLAPWAQDTCPICRTPFSDNVKIQLIESRQKIREEQEAANPELRSQRESRRFWGKFLYFTSLGLGTAAIVTIPLVIGEFFSGAGSQGPKFADMADIVIPTAAMTAIPLYSAGRRLGQGR